MDYDFIIIGSGFGGSVSALRLAEKGYRVAVVEQGRHITPADVQAAAKSFRQLMWMPRLGMQGFLVQHIFQHVGIVDGTAVSANVGVNPSLTITAMAERCMSLIPSANSPAQSSSL